MRLSIGRPVRNKRTVRIEPGGLIRFRGVERFMGIKGFNLDIPVVTIDVILNETDSSVKRQRLGYSSSFLIRVRLAIFCQPLIFLIF